MDKKIKFAFALNKKNRFGKHHFGDTDKYSIYEYQELEQKIKYVEEIENITNKSHGHGSERKGQTIIQLLKEKGVNVLVAMKFGKNIKIVNKHFVPIIISREHPDGVINALNKHIKWIKDELFKDKSEYKLFTIKTGILKSAIEKK